MFYDAMRCSEVSEPRAKIMYGAVYHCGPRWGSQQGIRFFPCDDDFGKRLVRRLRRYLSKNPETTRQNLADLNEGDLDGISGEGLQEVLARAPQVEVHENLDGFEIVIDGFDSGDGSLPNRSAEVLQRAAPLLRSYATSVTVEGHTDPTGTNDANMALSWHRAGSVRAELIKYGLDPEAVNANAYGEERPVEFGDDPESYARNRRVEIVVREIQ
jgi:outer membrane protein OmpA-like peptidoglycan-associated protein